MGQVALSQEPLEVAVGRGADVLAAKRRLLAAVTQSVGAMTLGAVVPVDESAGGYSFGAGSERVDAGVIPIRYTIQMRTGCGA